MSYPAGGPTNLLSKRGQVLAALKTTLEGITVANEFFTDVKRVEIYSAHRIMLGAQLPAIVILPEGDQRTFALACAQDEYSMTVQIVGVTRAVSLSDQWKDDAHKLVGDIQQALNTDRQLGGLAVYIEHEAAEISDGELNNETILSAAVSARIVYRIAVTDTTI